MTGKELIEALENLQKRAEKEMKEGSPPPAAQTIVWPLAWGDYPFPCWLIGDNLDAPRDDESPR